LSSGPIYAWYPLLEQAKQKGLHIKYICALIYARAIKIPFIPILITYFGVIYTTTLLVFLIIFAIVQGIVLEKIMQPKRQI
ncbi:MAG: permease, partial [Candidatus Nanoarchaeia archaeon]